MIHTRVGLVLGDIEVQTRLSSKNEPKKSKADIVQFFGLGQFIHRFSEIGTACYIEEEKFAHFEGLRFCRIDRYQTGVGQFVEYFDYRTFQLRKKSQQFDGDVASNVAKFVKMPRSQLTETEYDKADSISILAFSKERKDKCNSMGVHERVEMRFHSGFKKKRASSMLSARLSSKKSN